MIKMLKMFIIFSMSFTLAHAENDIPIIMQNSNSTPEYITTERLADIFLHITTKWDDNTDIVVVTMPYNTPAHRYFLVTYLDSMKLHQYQRTVDNKISLNRGGKPTFVDSNREMIDIISKTPGSIGYHNGRLYVNSNSRVQLVNVQ